MSINEEDGLENVGKAEALFLLDRSKSTRLRRTKCWP